MVSHVFLIDLLCVIPGTNIVLADVPITFSRRRHFTTNNMATQAHDETTAISIVITGTGLDLSMILKPHNNYYKYIYFKKHFPSSQPYPDSQFRRPETK